MIVDKISNSGSYHLGKAFQKAFDFLKNLKPEAPVGRHEIDGDKVYASIAEYTTSTAAPEKLEVHRKYIDIQATLSGSETLGWLLNDGFKVKTPYDPAKDFEFLEVPKGLVKFEISPGTFAIFLPQDAHIGKIAPSSGASPIKKVVIKVALELLGK